jgi:hypothetical protein
MSHKEEEPLIGPQRNPVAGPIVTIICLVISVASLVLVSVVLHRVYEDVDQGYRMAPIDCLSTVFRSQNIDNSNTTMVSAFVGNKCGYPVTGSLLYVFSTTDSEFRHTEMLNVTEFVGLQFFNFSFERPSRWQTTSSLYILTQRRAFDSNEPSKSLFPCLTITADTGTIHSILGNNCLSPIKVTYHYGTNQPLYVQSTVVETSASIAFLSINPSYVLSVLPPN